MVQYVSLLRGINVGGHRKIRMAELAELYTAEGCEEVSTYIQSGNVVFNGDGDGDALETRLMAAIKRHFKFDVRVMVRTREEWRAVLDGNPFNDVDEERFNQLVVTFLAEPPADEGLDALATVELEGERYRVSGREIYVHCDMGYGQSAIPNGAIEKLTKVAATTRNWRTVLKLADMLGQQS